MTDSGEDVQRPAERQEAERREAEADLRSRLLKLAQEAREGKGEGRELQHLPSIDRLRQRNLQQDIDLKKKYANWLLGTMIGQLVIADTVFVVYAWHGVDWELSATVINAWLIATLVEIIGIVLVVTRYLFPRRDIAGGA